MNKLYYISSDLFHLPSYPFLENFYKKLLELDCFKILETKGSHPTLPLRGQLNLTPDKLVQSLDINEQNKYSLICSHDSVLDEKSNSCQDVLVILHPLDITDLSKCIKNCIKLKASAILSELLPDEITDSIDDQLISFYAKRFSYLSAYHTQNSSSAETQKSNKRQLIIFDSQTDGNLHNIKIPEKSFLILATQPEIDALRFDLLNLKFSSTLISKMRDYNCVHLFINNPIKESFLASILNASAIPFYSNKSSLSPIRSLWNVSQQDELSSIFCSDDSIRRKLHKVISESKNNSGRIVENEQISIYSADFQTTAISRDLKPPSPSSSKSILDHIQDIYSSEISCLFSYSKIAKLDERLDCVPQWIMNPAMGQCYLSLINYFIENQDIIRVKALVENLMKFWKKYQGSLSRIAMQATKEAYYNLFDHHEEYADITPAIEKLIMHDVMEGTAQHDAIVVLYAYSCKNGRAGQSKQILDRVIEDKMLVVALPAILLYSWYRNINTNIDFTKISESLDDKNFHPYPERFLSLIILYLLNGLNEKAEAAFEVLATKNQKLFTIKSQVDTTLNRWHLMSTCYSLVNENERSAHFQKLAFTMDKKKEEARLQFSSKIDAARHKIQATIKIPDFATN